MIRNMGFLSTRFNGKPRASGDDPFIGEFLNELVE